MEDGDDVESVATPVQIKRESSGACGTVPALSPEVSRSGVAVLWGWALLFAYLSWVPFYYLQPLSFELAPATLAPWKYLPVGLLAMLAVAACAGQSTRAALIQVGVPRLLVCSVAVYGLISLASVAANAEYRLVGAMKAVYYGATGLVVPLIVVAGFRRPPMIGCLVRWMVFVAAVVALYGVVTVVVGSDPLDWQARYNHAYGGVNRASSTLGNPVVTGSYLSLCLPLAVWAYRSAATGMRAAFYAVCASVMTLGVALSFSRGAWGATAVALAVALWPGGRSGRSSRSRLGLSRAGLIFVACSVIVTAALVTTPYHERGELLWRELGERVRRTADLAETERPRLAQFDATKRVLSVYPFLGVGFGNYTRVYDGYQSEAERSGAGAPHHLRHLYSSSPPVAWGRVVTTDNMYLMVTCETGLVGLASFLIMLAATGWTLLRRWRLTPAGCSRGLIWALIAAFAGFVVNMVIWDALNHPAVRITYWMLVGLALAASRDVVLPRKNGHPTPPI